VSVAYNFSGRRVLVTGASRGIGFAVAEGFARAGAETTILASGEAVEAAAQELSQRAGRPVGAIRCDIAERDQVARAFQEIGALDVLVANAGLERPTPIREAGAAVEETFRRIVDINVIGTWYVAREAVAHMGAGGRIIVTSSIWGKTAVSGFSAYCATKHANIGFMRALAQELGPAGITVNAVCPGWVRTDASMNSLSAMAAREGRSEREMLDEIVAAQILSGLMEPDDVVGLYLFLASDAAANITGQAINVDRGEVMG
jgi:3-hydroxybutyrate dehydrogenase